jgi:hypothetical protein
LTDDCESDQFQVLQNSGTPLPVFTSTPSAAAAAAAAVSSETSSDCPSKGSDVVCTATFPPHCSSQAESAVLITANKLLSSSTLPVQGDQCQETGAGSVGTQSTASSVLTLSAKDLGWAPAQLPASPPAAKEAATIDRVKRQFYPYLPYSREAA